MRRRARVDKNQVDIVSDLRKAGCHVLHLHQLGNGCADTLVMYNGILLLVEIKSEGGRLTPDEQKFYAEWQDCMIVAYSAEEVLEAFGRLI